MYDLDSILLNIARQKQLFFDYVVIESVQDITRTLHRPQKVEQNPLIYKDKPWETVPYFSTAVWNVLYDEQEGIFKCIYTDYDFDQEGYAGGDASAWNRRMRQLYACSEDGINWVKPELGLIKEEGQDTNIIFGADEYGIVYGMSPIEDPEESDPDHRYKSLYVYAPPGGSFGRHGEVRVAHSPDLIHWTEYEQRPEFGLCGPHLNDLHIVDYDHQARQFVLGTRHYAMGSGQTNSASPSTNSWMGKYHPNEWCRRNNRRIFQTESSDFFHWSEPYLILAPDDEEDNIDDTFYGMARYRTGNVWVGLLNVFQQVANTMDVQLAYSRDGKTWKRSGQRQPWIVRGPEDAWDGVMASCCSVPLEVGDELWVYYGGAINHHDWWLCGLKEGLDVPEASDLSEVGYCLGLSKLRLDGFYSLDAKVVREGIIVTRPLLGPRPDESGARSRLVINAEVNNGGYLQAEVTDAADKVLDGYSREDCDTFTGDEVREEVTWQGRHGPSIAQEARSRDEMTRPLAWNRGV